MMSGSGTRPAAAGFRRLASGASRHSFPSGGLKADLPWTTPTRSSTVDLPSDKYIVSFRALVRERPDLPPVLALRGQPGRES
jgi:hypothetical protein